MALSWAMAALLLVYMFRSSAAGSCDDYNCVQGKCVEVDGFPPVKCVCDDGWSNVLSMSFLSCAIPNCDFRLHCDNSSKSTAADHSPSFLKDFDIFNPCTYSICGEGDCIEQNKSSSVHGYSCQCHPGYENLLNHSAGICVSNCNLGANCSQLDIPLSPSASPSSQSSKNGSSSTVSDINNSDRILPSVWTLLTAGGLMSLLF